MKEMLELSDKNFKEAIIKSFQQVRVDTLETNGKTGLRTYREREDLEKKWKMF